MFSIFLLLSSPIRRASKIVYMIILWLSMLPITSLSYDQHAKRYLFSQILPVSRKQIVMAKYVLGLLIIGVVAVGC